MLAVFSAPTALWPCNKPPQNLVTSTTTVMLTDPVRQELGCGEHGCWPCLMPGASAGRLQS